MKKFINKYTQTGSFTINMKKYTFDGIFETDEDEIIEFLENNFGFKLVEEEVQKEIEEEVQKEIEEEAKQKQKKKKSNKAS